MSIFKTLLLTIFTLTVGSVFGQGYYPPIVNYSTHDYGKEFNPENYAVVQDKRGVMYFGNGNGVLEFDGRKWDYIEVVPGSFTYSLAVDSSGVIYAGAYGDFGYLTPDEAGKLVFISLKSELHEDDTWFGEIWNIHATSEKVYFQAYESFFEYDIANGEVVTVYPDEVSSFHTSFLIDEVLYLRSREIGIVKYVDGDLERLRGTEFVRDLGVFGLHRLEDDSLMIVTQEIGLWKWADNVARKIEEKNEVTSDHLGIFGSKQLQDGNIALTTNTNGLKIIDQNGTIVRSIDMGIGLRSNDIKNVYEDRDQNLWLALGNGIAKVNYHSPLSYFNEIAGVEGNVQAMIRYNGQMFIGTSYGLFVQDLDRKSNKEFINSFVLKDQVWDFEVMDGMLYIASSAGIFKTDGKNYNMVNANRSNVIKYIPEKSVIVSAGPSGIYVYNKSFGLIWKKEPESSYSTFLSAVLDPQYENTLWLGTSNSGAQRLRFTDEGFVLDEYGFFDGLNDNELTKPIEFDDRIIFGTTQGVLTFIHEDIMIQDVPDSLKDDPDYYRGMFQTEELYDSSFTTQVLHIQEDEGRTWYSSEEKIGFYDLETKRFINKPFWGIDYGRINRFYLEEDGMFWIGCADGLIRYKRNHQKIYESNFHALIRTFTIDRDSVLFSGAFSEEGIVQATQTDDFVFELDYAHNDVKFTFSAPYFEDDHQPEYSYQLEGHDDRWSRWANKTEANFTNLNEGEYTFKVRARNIYGTLSEEAHFKFSILPPWYRTTWAFILYAVGLIVVFFIGFRLFSLRLKRKNQWLEGVVAERTKEISQKNEVLKHQKQEIEDSINYAQRIQEALLPLEQEMKRWLPNSFVLFRPKDIVSGDFYWFTEKDGKLVFICADCTGHGVPGAFMSMIGSDRLNIIVGERKVINPGRILSELNVAIKKSLKQDGHAESTKDGMDAAICTLDLKTNELRYAGANRPLWIVENGEITEIKATKVAVAGFTPDEQVYEEHVVQLKPNMKFYMTSDGYADQFGGEKGKKLKVKAMKELILKVCQEDFQYQRDELENKLMQWMGDHEQIDDVCVVGFEPLS